MTGFEVHTPVEQPDYTRVRWFDRGALREIYRVKPGGGSYDAPTGMDYDDERRWFEYGHGSPAWWTWAELLSQAHSAGGVINVDRSGAVRTTTKPA